jgi:hypothetical protein
MEALVATWRRALRRRRSLREIANVSNGASRHAATSRTTIREPIGPGAIVVDDKVVNIVTFSGAWPD